MKRIVILMSLLVCSYFANAQYADVPATVPATHNTAMHVRPRPGAMTITGIVLASTGPVVSGIGLATLIHESQKSYSPERPGSNNGPVIIGAGAAMVAAGVTLIIIGVIHDHKKANGTSFSFVAPRNKEIGIAYNF